MHKPDDRSPMTAVPWLKKLILPPSGPVLSGLAGLAVWAATSLDILGISLAAAGLAALYLLSIPATVTRWLLAVDHYPRLDPSGLPWTLDTRPQAIVILDGGRVDASPEHGGRAVTPRTLERLDEGARLHRQSGLPILVTGYGDLMAATLADSFSIEARWVENRSHNTHENAQLSARILHREGIERVALVTQFWHLRRALAACQAAGLRPIPVPAGRAARLPTGHGLLHLVPDAGLLGASYLLVHESLGMLWYRFRYRYHAR